jgi:hypothetical protein
MSDIPKILKIEMDKVAVRTFMASKNRRMPKDADELAEWLLEFSAEAWRITSRTQDAYTEHMNTCIGTRVPRW